MLFAIFFEDNDARSDMRALHMEDHLRFLARHGDAIAAAGPLDDAGTAAPAGGLWIVEAEGVDAARALVQADPFWPTGLRKSVRILAWRQVFADGKRLVG